MPLKLTQADTRALLEQPESGMGYQVVDAVTNSYVRKRGVVYNAELLTLDENQSADRILLSEKSADDVLKAAASVEFRSLTVVSDSRTTVLKLSAKASGPASEAQAEKTKADES